MKIAYQGEPGAFSEAAARRVAPDAQLVPCKSFEDVFAAVDGGHGRYGVLPIENSIGGSIHRNYDLLLEHELPIVGEVELPVVHHLLALPGTTLDGRAARLLASAGAGAVRAVPADAEAASRSSRPTTRRAAPRWSPTSSSTDAAAIASARAGEVFGLTALRRRSRTSTTTSRASSSSAGGRCRDAAPDKTTIVFSLPNEPGALFKALSVFALRGIDLTKLESRPIPGPALGVPVLRRPGRRARRAARARARSRTSPSSRRCCARSARTRAGRRTRAGSPIRSRSCRERSLESADDRPEPRAGARDAQGRRLHRRRPEEAAHRRRQHLDRDRPVQLPPARRSPCT